MPEAPTQLDLCIANVAGVVDPYTDAAWTEAKALKLDADIAAALDSPRRFATDRTPLGNAYERGMFTRDDLLDARRALAKWLAAPHEERLAGGPPPTRKETDMTYESSPYAAPRRGKSADERVEDLRRHAAERRRQATNIIASPGALDEVQSVLDDFWSLNDEIPARVRMEIGIAAAEIAANILEHGCVISLRMELGVTPNEVHVEFAYGGEAGAVDLHSVCMPDEVAERGRGLAIAQAVLSLLSYSCDEAGNRWKLVSKAFSNQSETQP
jgi:serine/threonine-protein kinase RsbW